jgi:CRISPR system Cascade subunit CasA
MTTRQTFDLLTEPWIRVRALDGGPEELSIRGVFAAATRLGSITGDLPTQSVAIYRLLLALLHRSVINADESETDQWARLWRAGELPLDRLNAYLDAHTERFDLLHPQTPFYQVADLVTSSGKTSGLRALIADVPNGAQYFTTRSGEALNRIGFAEAARWLIHCQAFDPSGIKSGAVGDDRVKGGKGYPIGTGWAGGLGLVLAEGRTVFETLLLNLVLVGPSREPFPSDDLPLWERPAQGAAVEARPGGEPTGPLDVLTWQSRRIRLIHDDIRVTDALICNGDPLSPQNRHNVELATAWRRSEPQEKKHKQTPVYMPRTHRADRSFWRGLSASLPQTEQTHSGRNASASQPPEVLRWLRSLLADDVLDAGFRIRLRAVGVEYGSNNSVIDEVIDDVLLLHGDVLANPVLRTHASDAVVDADAAVAALVNLAGNLVLAAGGESDGARSQAREAAFFVLDGPYRLWVSELTDQTDLAQHRALWQHAVREVVETAARRLVDEAGTPAWIGRHARGTFVDTSLARGWFVAALAKALPLAFEAATATRS